MGAYFLGASTAAGFRTEFEAVINGQGMYTYILKGGAGTGKSSMMRRIAEHFEDRYEVDRWYCSSDPDSLDAVVIPELGAAVCDGTSPHVFEPRYPGVRQEYVDLGAYWDKEKLAASTEEIIRAADENKALLARAQRFITAAGSIKSDAYQLGNSCLLCGKLAGFAGRLSKRLLGKRGSGTGKRELRRLTALTQYGELTLHETLASCLDVYVLSDELFAASDHLLSVLADEAAQRGYDTIVSPDQLLSDSVYQHLLIPELGVALIGAKAAEGLEHDGIAKINMMRFYDKEQLSKKRPRLRLDRAALSELTAEVSKTQRAAKLVHDELESFYISAMDFPALDRLCERLIGEIKGRE
ncbi:MAG: ATPase [Ruminococcus sp.]|nr:ATPase [Ruminococcus sp.]